MTKRRQMLEKLVAEGSSDPFHRYALALEYKREKRFDEALGAFESLRQAHPDYLPMYLLAGSLLAELDRSDEAESWFEQGLTLAKQQEDTKTVGELEEALEQASEAQREVH